ncbi:MAG: SUMF1/EgtB/PvdO family nonheme iron enzyme [Verrucomicrobia bacterium]|nr:SUMF1/EgtB/PvdO family nonheme iron enzyme [Verrucomicrobiota bacterium]
MRWKAGQPEWTPVADPSNLDLTQPLPHADLAFSSRYRMKAELGRGGMGVVWRAEDTKLQRDVALKFLPDLVVRDREAMADLAAETRRCLDLTHPHIVRVYDLVEEVTRAAISMELVEGGSLAERKLRQPDRCFSVAAIAPWIAQLCSALDYAHTKVRLVHRDLKPLNLLIDSRGDLKVVDFGIARSLLNSGTRLSGHTKSASVSLGYAGPQQLMGEPAAVTDDIYSLGATVYELLTGKPPFYEGDIITQLREIVPPSMTARRAALGVTGHEPIPEAWEKTIAACLAKKAEDRPQSAGEVAARLGFPLAGSSPAEAATVRLTVPSQSRGKPLVIGIAVIAVIGAAVAVFWPRAAVLAPIPVATVSVPPPAPPPAFVVTVSPPDADASVSLAEAANEPVPADGRLALPGMTDGDHDLTVRASGYKTYTARVTVTDHVGTAAVKLEPVFGPVEVVARPGTVVTAVNERGRVRAVGTVPASGSLRADQALTVGTYLFKLVHPDCLDAQQANIAVRQTRPLARVLVPQTPVPGQLRVHSSPDGAEVVVNGTRAGVTPATLPNQPSEKPLNVEIFVPGHRREKRAVVLKPREDHTLNFGALVVENGVIELRQGPALFALPATSARVDGYPFPLNKGRIAGLEVGKHELEIVHRDFEPWKQPVTVPPRQPAIVDVKLQPKPAELTLDVTGTKDFSLTANGKAVPLKNNRASVPAFEELSLEISARGFRTVREKLTLPANGKKTLRLTLEKSIAAEVGEAWTVPDLGVVLLPVAAGTFAMGSETGDLSEKPVTRVTLTKPFWLGKTEVTQREWTRLMGGNPAKFKGDTLPVENVSWQDAVEFCAKLTARERAADRLPPGYVYGLPTEAQWEYAARAGDPGDLAPDIVATAWHEQNSTETTHPVAMHPANAWGFHDMQGNVWEWCADHYAAKLKGGSVTDPRGVAGADYVRRGGSYMVKPAFLRFAYRGKGEPEFRWYNIGFRLALVPGS